MTHTSTDQPELLPCPFCGEKAHFDIDDENWEWIECEGCGMQGNSSASLMEDCKPKLREAWNRRTPASQAQRVPLSDEWIKELMGLVSRYGNLNYQECDADYREHQTKSGRYAQDQRDTFSAIESKLRTIGITQEKQG